MSSDFLLLKNQILKSLQSKEQIGTQSVISINPKNCIDLIIKTMSVVDSYYNNRSSTITGESKKQLVLNLVYDIIDISGISIENKNYIIHLVNNVFDPLVENIIDITKGQTNINKKTNCFINFFNKCINKNSVL